MPKRIVYKTALVFLLLFTSWAFSTKQTQTVHAGTTPPTTTVTLTPGTPDGNNGWYVSPVDILIEATDLESGVSEINYRINERNWVSTPFGNTLNLAPNPSFEIHGVQAPLNTDEWALANPADTSSFSRTTAEYYPPAAITSVEIGSTIPGWHAINHKNDFAVATPFSNMSATVQAKTDSVNSAYFKVFAVSLDGLGQPVYAEIAQSTSISGTNGWTTLTSSFVVSVADAIGVYIEPGLDGAGTVWFDAVTLNESISNASVNILVGTDGEYTLEYYSVDRLGNTEAVKSTSFKIDQTPPGNWEDAGAYRDLGGGAEHELYTYTTVNDATSGISTNSDKYQYIVDAQTVFGHHANILGCNTDWKEDEWYPLNSPPFNDGDNSVYLLTPKTDYCNSNWKICKTVRFYAEDMAGNTAQKDFCLNGPWVSFRGEGIVGSRSIISMIAEPEDDSADGLVEIRQNIINFFSNTPGWNVRNYDNPMAHTYSSLWDSTKSKTEITDGDLVAADGIYNIEGNFTIDNQSTPSNYNSATFDQIVFINGNLLIDNDITVSNSSTALFIVNGDVTIAKKANNIGIGIFAEGDIFTSYDLGQGESSQTLDMNGVYYANKFVLQRTLQGANNNDVPSENFVYEPKYLIGLKDFFEGGSVKWLGVK
jgi:hypothetical protein